MTINRTALAALIGALISVFSSASLYAGTILPRSIFRPM